VTRENRGQRSIGLRDSTGTGGDQKFCGTLGHTTEPDTGGLIYMRARWMDPVTGRFVSEDPARDGENWYGYVGGNPVSHTKNRGQRPIMHQSFVRIGWRKTAVERAFSSAAWYSGGGSHIMLDELEVWLRWLCAEPLRDENQSRSI